MLVLWHLEYLNINKTSNKQEPKAKKVILLNKIKNNKIIRKISIKKYNKADIKVYHKYQSISLNL
jgi:hypothetical protein